VTIGTARPDRMILESPSDSRESVRLILRNQEGDDHLCFFVGPGRLIGVLFAFYHRLVGHDVSGLQVFVRGSWLIENLRIRGSQLTVCVLACGS